MFDKNYLGHDFISFKHKLSDHYICEKCNVIFYCSDDGQIFRVKEMDNIKNGQIDVFYKFISCDEWIIKNIIE